MSFHVDPDVNVDANSGDDDGESPGMAQAVAQICSFGAYPTPIATDGGDLA